MKMKTKESRINLAKRVISRTYIWNVFFYFINSSYSIEPNFARNYETTRDLHIVRIIVLYLKILNLRK